MNTEQQRLAAVYAMQPQWVKARPEWIEEELARRSCLDMLMSRFGIDAALVSAPQLAKALGLSKSTVYASLKEGRFFIPHRMVGRSPVFTIDAVVTWYRSGGAEPQALPMRLEPRAASRRELEDESGVQALRKRQRDGDVDVWVAKAVAAVEARARS